MNSYGSNPLIGTGCIGSDNVKLQRRGVSLLIIALLVIGSVRLPATPVTYHFDDPGWGFAGQGYFTFDLGTALGTYSATGFSGGGWQFSCRLGLCHVRGTRGYQPQAGVS